MDKQKKGVVYPHVFPRMEDWPIFKLSEDRKQFVQELSDATVNRITGKNGARLAEILAKSVYLERIRVKEEPWKVDPPNEMGFWKKLQRQIVQASSETDKIVAEARYREILDKMINRYSEEIVGTFKITTFLFARRFLTMFFGRLLNTAAGKNIHRFWDTKYRLQDKLLVRGEIEQVRTLMKKGTVVVLPTHFSNLDSILIGYAMDAFAGLPSFSYGAGLNLYNTGYTAYFMNRLGAYRVDRRKKNPIYLETLKIMSNLSLQRGVNSLFFPGGTRSRSGNLETRLKLGLLGSVIEAQRSVFQNGHETKIFVVPLVISYHFVLEANYLIDQYLRQIGKEKYLRSRDEFYSIRKNLKFLWKFFSASSEITLGFGKPMDVIGNFVDSEGNSFDSKGRQVEVQDYFKGTNGAIEENLQRESEYTKILSEIVVRRFYQENVVLSSHLVAFAAFKILERENPNLDLFAILRLPPNEYTFPVQILREVVSQLKTSILTLADEKLVKASEEITLEIDALIEDGLDKIGVYHADKPLKFNKKGCIVSENFKLLFYYHNRLEGYGLEKTIVWSTSEKELVEAMEKFALDEG
jgi:glycerol-3-phosphate O-acyltransferase